MRNLPNLLDLRKQLPGTAFLLVTDIYIHTRKGGGGGEEKKEKRISSHSS